MSAQPARGTPAVVRSTSLDFAHHRSFLADVVIDKGPRQLLGRLMLMVDTDFREKGVVVSYATFEELVAVNKANSASWSPLLPIFDPAVSDVSAANGNVLMGRNSSGEVVYTQAVRKFELLGTLLKDELESLRVLYRDPDASRAPGEAIEVSAPIASIPRDEALFTGAQWYRPDYRKKNLLPLTTVLTRCIYIARWDPDFAYSFCAPAVVRGGVPATARMHSEWGVTMINTPVLRNGTIQAALIWSDARDMLEVLQTYAASRSTAADAEINGLVPDRAANQKRVG